MLKKYSGMLFWEILVSDNHTLLLQYLAIDLQFLVLEELLAVVAVLAKLAVLAELAVPASSAPTLAVLTELPSSALAHLHFSQPHQRQLSHLQSCHVQVPSVAQSG